MFEQSILGLDVGSWSVKFAELRAGLRDAHFVRFEELILPDAASPEELEATVQLFAQQRSLPLDYLVTALDTRVITQRHLRFPFTGARRVIPAIDFEIDEELPVDVEDVVTAHDMVRLRRDQTDVLVLIAAREELERYLASMHRMEFEPQHIDAEGAVLANLTRFFGLEEVPRLVLDIGHEKTNLCLLVDGHPIALRRIPVAGAHLTRALAADRGWSPSEAQDQKHEQGVFERGSTKPLTGGVRDVLDRLSRETLRSMQSVVGDPSDPLSPAEVLLVGGSARLPQLDAYLAERIGLPCRVLGPPADESGEIDPIYGEIAVPAFAQAMALGLRSARTEAVTDIDFRTGEFAHQPDLAGMRSQLQITALLFGALMLLWALSAGVRTFVAEHDARAREAVIASIHDQLFPGQPIDGDPLAALESRARETRELAAHLGVTATGSSALELVREISTRAPAALDVQLDDLRITGRTVTARGHGRDTTTIEQFKAALARVPEFSDVQIANVARDPRRGGRMGFTLNVRLPEGS